MEAEVLGGDAYGRAALSLSESLVLAIAEKGLIDPAELAGVLSDAIAVHRSAAAEGGDVETHLRAAALLERFGESVRSVAPPRRTAGWRA
jgi:hypothetical protein